MGKFLKKNWFVMLVVAVFLAISVYYIYDTNKGKLKGKQTNGEDVVYSIDDNDTTASEFYETLFRTNGSSAELTLFKRAIADASISTTNEIKDAAAKQAESVIANYNNSYGANYEAKLHADMAKTGYTDLEESAKGTDPKDATSKPTTGISPIADQTVVEGRPIAEITVTTDNPAATVTVKDLPTGVTYDPSTKKISGTPSVTSWTGNDETKDFTVTVEAKDSANNVV